MTTVVSRGRFRRGATKMVTRSACVSNGPPAALIEMIIKEKSHACKFPAGI